MRTRGQIGAALLVLVLAVSAGAYLQAEVGPKPLAAGPPGVAPSGAWFCPHGGGAKWEVSLEVANPGPSPVPIRVTQLSAAKPAKAAPFTVAPQSTFVIPLRARDKSSASFVEYFGGWVGTAWVARGAAGETGVAAEPCLPAAGRQWFLPDGMTTQHEDAYAVVMNPFSSVAVFTLTLFTHDAPVTPAKWTNVVLKAHRSAAFYLNRRRLGYVAVSTEVDVKVGRVAAASLGVSGAGGIRSSVGISAPLPARTILPSGFDQGAATLVVMNPGEGRARTKGMLLSRDTSQTVSSLVEGAPAPRSASVEPVTTEGPSTIVVTSTPPVGLALRTLGVNGDQGATVGASAAASAWVVLPAVAGPPANPGLVLANPGTDPAVVTLSYLPSGGGPVPAPVTVTVQPGRTSAAPKGFVTARPFSGILARATSGTFVAEASSYSLGQNGIASYATSLGVPLPTAWIPS
jgi:Family of unknown function (DUF5719)